MALKIADLYANKKFELIVFYLNEHGIFLSEDLASFDFSELMFVPGISSALIEDARSLYLKNLSQNHRDIAENSTATRPATLDGPCSDETPQNMATPIESNTDLESPVRTLNDQTIGMILTEKYFDIPDSGHSSLATSENEMKNDIYDASIEEVFAWVPRGSAFIRYCLKAGIKNVSQLSGFSFDSSKVKGIGPKSMGVLHQVYLEAINRPASNNQSKLYSVEIASENLTLPINILTRIGVHSSAIDKLKNSGFSTLADFYGKSIPECQYLLIQKALPRLSVSMTLYFQEQLSRVGERSKYCLVHKSQGETLQKIGETWGLTRERVRQIINKSCKSLRYSAKLAAFSMFTQDKEWFTISELEQRFSDPVTAACCKYVLTNSNTVRYLAFSDKFVNSEVCIEDIDSVLYRFVSKTIGDGINFNDTLETIDIELIRQGLGFLNFKDIMNFMVKNGYHFYGDYALKGGQSYAIVCYDAILKFFPFDIKLDSEDDNEDIEKLRQIIDRWYTGLSLPSGNRALAARLANFLVLCGRGRYCPIEKADYNAGLLDEVYEHIQNSPQTSFYYSELFTLFQGRFLAETNITNPHFLHGMLQYIYQADFKYERDLLVKRGKTRSDNNERICSLIVSRREAVTLEEIKKAVPGLNDFVMNFVVARVPKLIRWDHNAFNHMDNISLSLEDIKMLEQVLSEETTHHQGYLSEGNLFQRVKNASSLFLEKNKIASSVNLYYITACLFDGRYRFRHPHIVTIDFPVEELSAVSIAKVLLGCKTELSYRAYVSLANSSGWANGTFYSIFSELEKGFVRISEDNYIAREAFKCDEAFLKETIIQIGKLVDDSGYFAFRGIYRYDSFPSGAYKWNGFLLESIINEFSTGFRIISPQLKDRRIQRGIIIRSESPTKSFEDLVIHLLNQDGITSLTEAEMAKYLKNKGIVTKDIPLEIYNCSLLPYKNEAFSLH